MNLERLTLGQVLEKSLSCLSLSSRKHVPSVQLGKAVLWEFLTVRVACDLKLGKWFWFWTER